MRAFAQSSRSQAPRPLVGGAGASLLRCLQLGLRWRRRGGFLACRPHRAPRRHHVRDLSGRHRFRAQHLPANAGRFHPASRRGLSDCRGAIAARRFALAHRRGTTTCARHRPAGAGRRARRQRDRLLRCHLHQCAEFWRHFPHPQAVRGAREGFAPIGGRYPGRAQQAPVANPGSFFDHRAAAAGAWHQQCRWLPHDHRRSRRPRLRGAAHRRRRVHGARRADAGPDTGLHAVRNVHPAGLSRDRPHQGAAPRRQRAGRIQRAAGLYRLRLRKRLQLVRPHLPGHRAGARRRPA